MHVRINSTHTNPNPELHSRMQTTCMHDIETLKLANISAQTLKPKP